MTARAQLALGELESAATTADRGLIIAESMGYGAVIWRLKMVRARAAGDSEGAAAEFRVLADRISEPDLRRWFEAQPLAPTEMA